MQKPLKITAADRAALEQLKVLLDADFEAPASLQDLCRKTGLNRDKLKRGFKLLYGQPPHTYQRIRRFKEAQRLLADTELPVSEIAYAVGYEQPNNFSTSFLKYAGCSPLCFRSKKQ